MKIETVAFGAQEVDPDTLIEFAQGLPGFESSRRYKLFHQAPDDAVHYLQSADDPELAFSVVEAGSLHIAYEFSLDDREQQLLDMRPEDELMILLITYRRNGGNPGGDVGANLMGPLLINPRSRRGMQKVLNASQRRVTISAEG